ncbi:MAG: YIP1 family protein, partial [Gammaproteobacteria bacterium]|nr:YIP1 family protein [Gammaproteobacteria bacterium]
MDFNKLIARVKAILLTPKTEWPVIAAEEASVGGLYKDYIVWLAGVSALASFIAMSLIGRSLMLLGTFRMGFMAGLTRAILSLLLALVFTWLFAWLIDALAPSFGGQKNRVQALKAAAYS